jgi:VanZ family protein
MIGKLVIFLLRKRAIITVLLFFITLIILYLTLIPAEQLGDSTLFDYDKLGHFMLFFSWTFVFGLYMFSARNFKTKLFFIFVAGSLFGILIEVAQEIMPYGRQGNVDDAIVDIAGCFTATLLLYGIKKRYLKKYKRKSK